MHASLYFVPTLLALTPFTSALPTFGGPHAPVVQEKDSYNSTLAQREAYASGTAVSKRQTFATGTLAARQVEITKSAGTLQSSAPSLSVDVAPESKTEVQPQPTVQPVQSSFDAVPVSKTEGQPVQVTASTAPTDVITKARREIAAEAGATSLRRGQPSSQSTETAGLVPSQHSAIPSPVHSAPSSPPPPPPPSSVRLEPISSLATGASVPKRHLPQHKSSDSIPQPTPKASEPAPTKPAVTVVPVSTQNVLSKATFTPAPTTLSEPLPTKSGKPVASTAAL